MSDLQSGFLTPQKPIEDPLGQIDLLPFMIVQKNYFYRIRDEPIAQNLFDLADKLFITLKPNTPPYSQDLLPKETLYNGYRWSQNGNKIIITFNSPDDITENQIEITKDSITSPFLSGNFYDEVRDPQISISNNKVTITLTVSKPFIILIKSGANMDKYSQFFLATYSNQIGQMELFDRLLIKSASSGLIMAMTTLAVSYLQREEREQSVYWFYRFAQETKEIFAYSTIADLLLQIDAPKYVFLAENILLTLAPKFPQAYKLLAGIHLDKIPGFNSSDSLAKQYLEISIRIEPSPDALRSLAQLYITGRGVEKDVSLGERLLVDSGFSPDQAKKAVEILTREEKENGQNKEKGSIMDTIADYSISALLLVGSVAVGLFLFDRFKHRKSK